MDTLRLEEAAVCWSYEGQWLRIEAHGADGLRLRASIFPEESASLGALLHPEGHSAVAAFEGGRARISNGRIMAEIDPQGRVRFMDATGRLLLEEKWRQRDTVTKFWTVGHSHPGTISALSISGREFKPIRSGAARITLRFEAKENERLFGMGQYQQPNLDLAGCVLELAQRNSQASVPFVVSSHGYGLLWNMPAVGEACFGLNGMRWTAEAARTLDFWITAGDTPADIVRRYAAVTGTAPSMPKDLLGLWQSKLRYRTQHELLEVAREYARRNIPLSVVVADFFHWPVQGDWKFDSRDWPDPTAMVKELKSLGTRLMVSVWPTVDPRSDNYSTMAANGYLVHSNRGISFQQDFLGNTRFVDFTNPGARRFVWDAVRHNYSTHGVDLFWLDEAEPEFSAYDYDNYRYHAGDVLETGNLYPYDYVRAFDEGARGDGASTSVNLVRCAWAGSQRHGALVWSGDIQSSFASMRNQISAGLNMGMAGIPWWTTDVGGFHGGHVREPAFHELLVRWFQWAVFSPILRMHGHREPITAPSQAYRDGVAQCDTGAGNEIWSFGEDVYDILRRYVELRERLRPYISELMHEAHLTGDPLMRTMFYVAPNDETCWEISDQYFFGPDLIVAPVLSMGCERRDVYLPAGAWVDVWTGRRVDGGRTVSRETPLHVVPVFAKADSPVLSAFSEA